MLKIAICDDDIQELSNIASIIGAYYMIFRFFRQTREQLTLQSAQNLLINQVAAARLLLKHWKNHRRK
ncbi:MAG: hypothetical protein K0Q48_2692 [Bacillota bacterium]|jgi:hypothetical protein|nr:hypothetical protein [Bacillota bacterium]